jgi:AmmeMemoRadiSam system protein B
MSGTSQERQGRKPLLRNLQFSPIKQQDEQYIVLWDPSGLTSEKLIIPLNYFYLVQFFDGEHTLEQIGGEYLRRFGEFLMPDRLDRLVTDMDNKLFLEGARAEAARQAATAAYRSCALRPAGFSGKSYEADGEKLKVQLEGFFKSKEGPGVEASANAGRPIKGLVVPHYEMRLGGPIYAWAYKEMKEAQAPDLFVLLGTSHAGLKNLFALTDKDFETPLGVVPVDRELVDVFRRKAGDLFFEEDVAHGREHSIEFQLPFLQYTRGTSRPFSILPILCAFPPAAVTDPHLRPARSHVEGFLGMLNESLAELGRPSCVVASADLAHIGLRYGDPSPPSDFSFHKCMQSDLAMLKHVEELNPDAFAAFIRTEEDRRRICGFSPIYSLLTLLKASEATKGEVLRYDRGITDQFNSTVTYASMTFF